MTIDESILEFGITPKEHDVAAIRDMLREATAHERARQGASDTELMKLCCVQLFCAGHVEDVIPIWRAKTSSMDTDGSIDIQLLCGAGLNTTKHYLASLQTQEGAAALDRLTKAEAAGDFEQFSAADYRDFWRQYYLEPLS